MGAEWALFRVMARRATQRRMYYAELRVHMYTGKLVYKDWSCQIPQ